ncbi:MAG: sigma-70 family RNA polymerase sigma factor [Bacteroidota bacterium]|nr:sigma-70 family RNA polymerase sigma factor [Bacteroidota bacterium]
MEDKYINIHQDLIDACKEGNRNAQFKIYKLYYRAMFNTSLRIVNDTQEAEDVMQESFLDAFRNIGRYTGEGSFGSWLKKIVINNSLDVIRKSHEMVSIDEEGIDIQDVTEDHREEELKMQVNEVKEAIAGLPDSYRVILSLFLFEGYDHEEISSILHISNNLSRTRFVRAKQKLVKIIIEKRQKRSYHYN